jgi:hypothetical protein
MAKHEIHIDASTLRNEIQEKLKALKKFEASEEFTAIKEYCTKQVETLEVDIRAELQKRCDNLVSPIAREPLFSELDLFLLNRLFLEMIKSKSTSKDFIKEVDENIEALESHLFLQSGNFDFAVYSKLDSLKHAYKLHLGVESAVKQMITKYELQDKEVDLNQATNAYAEPKPVSGELKI